MPPLGGDTPGLLLAAAGVAAAIGVHAAVPAVPKLTAAVVLGMAAAHLPGLRPVVRGVARSGLSLAGKRLMRLGIVLLGLKLSLGDVLGLGWATVAMVLAVVAATFTGTLWLGRRLGLPGDQPLLVATGYSICGASAIGAVSQAAGSDEEDVASSVALVTLCGTLAIAVLPLLQHPLGLGDVEFGRWVGASVHDVGQVVATAQSGGAGALREAVLVKLMRVVLLAPLVAGVAVAVRRQARWVKGRAGADAGSEAGAGAAKAGARPPIVPLFVAGFLAMIVLRTTGVLPERALGLAGDAQELLLAAALFGLGSAVHLPTMIRTGGRIALLGLASWVVVAGVSYAGVLVTT
ncbi:YeiH family protein [Kitasatospora sp. NPDC094028]